jgi:serine O-acetyltransferase
LDELLNRDGHPTYINKAQYITDTYPDRCAMQHIYLCEEHISKMELLSVYHVPNKVGEYRCDLHPRIKNDLINIDCVMYRERCQFILKPKDSTKTHKKAKSISKEVYSTLTGKIGCNYLSLLYNKCFNTTFKAHYLVLKMLRTKSKLCKNMIFNKLQSKYSMWVSPDCSLGKNVRFMHIQGIVIGSGVTVGDNCILYQQVTLGKEKGAFPVIGNNVKIYAGAKVIGNVKVGDNAVIGANAVVTHDVPPNAVVGGVPARILKQNEGK